MNRIDQQTFFASPERSTAEELASESRLIMNSSLVKVILQAVSGYALILNEHRQILAGNLEIMETLNLQENDILGLRPGELLHCKHSHTAHSGCGTCHQCQNCGAVLSILAAQQDDKPASSECRLQMSMNNEIKCLDFQVQTTPLQCGSHKMLVFVLQDISSAKRRDVLERVFLHDINNILGALTGYCSLLEHKNDNHITKQIIRIAERLRDEVSTQELLISAEKGILQPKVQQTALRDIISRLNDIFSEHKCAEEKTVIYQPVAEIEISTDPVLLHKILVNMLKNALEATPAGGEVKLSFDIEPNAIRFRVHNHGFIPETTLLNIFHRSFSTKPGSGRGIGTYSMKLFGENYLHGQVGFTSSEEEGTVFYIELPYSL